MMRVLLDLPTARVTRLYARQFPAREPDLRDVNALTPPGMIRDTLDGWPPPAGGWAAQRVGQGWAVEGDVRLFVFGVPCPLDRYVMVFDCLETDEAGFPHPRGIWRVHNTEE